MDYGFDAVISPRFADIFRNNATKNGLVPVVLPAAVVERLQAAIDESPDLEVVIDVERLVVEVPALGLVESFPLDPAIQHRFLEGLDDIGITLSHEAEIERYETARAPWLPTVV
jgi:3-isopropylmalate/(R)-2-methylmalate dehydratase small subunit